MYLDITLPNYRGFEVCAQLHVDFGRWDSQTQKLKSIATPEDMLIEHTMNDMAQRACGIYMLHTLSNKPLNPTAFKELLSENDKTIITNISIPELADRYIENNNISLARQRGIRGSVRLYTATPEASQFWGEIKPSDAELFVRYINSQLSPSSCAQYLATMKTLYDYGLRLQLWESSVNPFSVPQLKTIRKEESENVLTVTETHELIDYLGGAMMSSENYVAVRYAYLQLVTGCAFTDISHTVEDRLMTIKGNIFYEYKRQKTGVTAKVLLEPSEAECLKEYFKLMYTKKKLSPYVYKKRLRGICGKEVNSHDLRKAFGTYKLAKGYGMESVSRMLGHASIKETEKVYAKIGYEKLIAESVKIS